jgi:hypothetical protein
MFLVGVRTAVLSGTLNGSDRSPCKPIANLLLEVFRPFRPFGRRNPAPKKDHCVNDLSGLSPMIPSESVGIRCIAQYSTVEWI